MLGMTPETVLYDISYKNLMMYGYASPNYDDDENDDKPEWDESLDANNPDNFKSKDGDGDDEEEETVYTLV